MAGYSSTPLVRKLGIKPGNKICLVDAPADYLQWVSPLPDGVKIFKKLGKDPLDFVHLFANNRKYFEHYFIDSKAKITKSGMLWVSWPKKSSGVTTDLNEQEIREFGLKNGLVDVKVCAVSDVWSGLKFVYRTADR